MHEDSRKYTNSHITRFKNILKTYFLDTHLTYQASLYILAQFLGFMVIFILNFYCSTYVHIFSVIGAI